MLKYGIQGLYCTIHAPYPGCCSESYLLHRPGKRDPVMIFPAPKTVLCIHDLSALGRAGFSAVAPVLAVSGLQAVALPTVVLSSHTGGLGEPARISSGDYGEAALCRYQALGIQFDYIYSGYLAHPAQTALVEKAHSLWPQAFLTVDPVMGDNGRLYGGVSPDMPDALRRLAAQADLILPNATEAAFLLDRPCQSPADADEATALAAALQQNLGAKSVVVTGLPIGRYLYCAGAGRDPFISRQLKAARSFPGTGDLFGAVLISRLALGNALSAASEAAAAFVAECIAATPADADARLGVCFEPLLWHLAAR